MITGWLLTDTIVTMFISAKEAHQSMLKIFASIVSNHFRSASGMPTLRSYPRQSYRFREKKRGLPPFC